MTTTTWILLILALGLGGLVGWLLGSARATRGAGAAESERLRFKAAAADALEANSRQFLDLATQTLRTSSVQGENALARREQSIRALIEPLDASLTRIRVEVAEAERARIEGQATLAEQLRHLAEANAELSRGTGDLVTALRSSQTRGAWGELQLRRVVEAAGMLRNVDFVEQASVATDDGPLRPDMVVRLAGGKNVVVDAKVAFLGVLEARQTTDPAIRAERLDAHVRHLRKHVDDLAGKQYWEQFSPAPEFVVMFVPAEAFLSAAVEQDPSLMEYAAARRVILATPMTLLALLRTIAYSWKQDVLANNAQQVLDVGKELYGRLVTMTGHITRTGRALSSAVWHYNAMIGSLEGQVLVSARRMVALGVIDESQTIDELSGIEVVPRPITRTELLAADE
jgi:DNA recombination protein RmuC